MRKSLLMGMIGAAGLLVSAAASADTLEDVQARGVLKCGVNTGLAGFAFPDADGRWEGFDVAVCRAVAAAVLDDPEAVEFVPTTTATRFTTLASGEVDLLSRNSTWTYTRDADLGLDFTTINYFDGQGFIVPVELGVTSAHELDGATVCIQTGTTTELNLSDFFRTNGMSYNPLPVENNIEGRQQYLAGACDTYTTDASGLAATRATFEIPAEHIVLPEIISKEPLGPVVRQGDDTWGDIVRWTLFALMNAEEMGITQDNVVETASTPNENPEINRMLGIDGEFGAMLGLPNDWVVKVISAVGNYGEIFDRYIGADTEIGIERGLNALWTDGGLIYPMPFR